MLAFIFMVIGLLLVVSLLFVAFAFGTRNRGKQNVNPVAKDPHATRARAIDSEN